ncbi:Penicillin-binding protein 1A (Includes: Penicillin-insensitive transglycosylase; Penicillin-sensitive transpeptidase) [Vibrio coralliirubri]|uniref:Penicillin-binding protein 1A n=2 Tax=Vibrionaceae TaxID=641 RepID=A0AA86WX19_9VIBR|nr:PBP1A family penicillin-binding protein [Vibrio sp. 1CM8B]CDT22330.1 Penicillin-binding protein 1A (Includes: Penicillin-insensitive transglycosylase; Penicillin-sensitive transpeptidase) [Vibrio coralliirubri]CDT99102.1 Penicillin-binding protein 1A (Includes: Penicillin-insensitive transglycosylase; Penicillin-sensitive transpeptidase) [Vibrio coralliirubri]CDT99231.1 Penicillin-binding protein 1A (Includes: Penicillin-insensitive transglycosylase; Penicillin-sensitive transpeptidase) [Vibr
MILGVSTIFGFYYYVKPELPDVATLRDVELQTPMQVFSQDGKLISQFGEKRRNPVTYDEIPRHLVEALIATEDSRFYEHPGIDPIGITRAALVVAMSGSAKQGASTITQQLARNFFLSNEKKIMRKIKEIFIAIHIEQLLSKEEIMELYVNKIFLGHRSYGFGAAARVYFGKDLPDLTLSEIATLAGMPKAPSTMNPIYSVERATNRRNVVLRRMLDEKYITQAEFDDARSEEIISKYHGAEIELSAPYVAEVARAWMVERYGEEAYTSGMKVYTTVDSKLQKAANQAAIKNLLGYDERHGYRGAEKVLWQTAQSAWDQEQIVKHLKSQPTYGDLVPAVVTAVDSKSAQIWVKNQGEGTIEWQGMNWARKFLTDNRQGPAPSQAKEILAVGEQIWVRHEAVTGDEVSEEPTEESATAESETPIVWRLSQVPNANTAFVAMNPNNGAVLSMVGGFNFVHNKFNRATQSIRQVGSGIKPFIYSAAIEKGLTLASLINDAPINQWDKSQGTAWRPKNSPPTYVGPTRLRIGLAQSKNVMAVRVLREVGLDDTRNYLTRFGFDIDEVPRSETIALGAGSLTPMKVAQGYSVFANGGYYVEPFYISRIETPFGETEFEATPKVVCKDDCQQQMTSDPMADEFAEQDVDAKVQYAPQVISEQNAFLVREMMYSNIWGGGDWSAGTGWNGTGWRAQPLKRRDIGGKTGTTNDSKDTWYSGYGPGMVATVWVGFDNHNRNLGRTKANSNLGKNQITGAEAGAKTAEPAWVDFMGTALAGVPAERKEIPENIVRVRIDRETGLLTNKFDSSSMFEYFEKGTEPTEYITERFNDDIYSTSSGEAVEELF